ncbi:MAG: copper chaperone PCu(A)C [Ottowia sp.]
MKYVVVAAAALLAMQVQAAEPAVATHTELKDCTMQEVLPGKDMTGAYVRIVHKGAPVDVVKAEIPTVSKRIELHSMAMKDNVMHMVPMTDVKINEGERVFKKGGDHVMLFDVAEKPAVGSKHTMTLYFSDNTKASCEAVVKTVQDVMKDAGLDPENAAAKHDDKHMDGHGKH